MTKRFHFMGLSEEVRSLILKNPVQPTNQADALEIMLGSSLPGDVSSPLKVFDKVSIPLSSHRLTFLSI